MLELLLKLTTFFGRDIFLTDRNNGAIENDSFVEIGCVRHNPADLKRFPIISYNRFHVYSWLLICSTAKGLIQAGP